MPKTRLINIGEYTTGQLADYLGVSVATVKDWANKGKIPAPAFTRGVRKTRIWNQKQADEIKARVRPAD